MLWGLDVWQRFFIGLPLSGNLPNPPVKPKGGGHGWPERPLSPDGELAVKPEASPEDEVS